MRSALHQLVGRIERALEAKEYTLGVFFDIVEASDNTSCRSVKHALDERKVHRSVRTWIVKMLENRTIMVKTDNITYMVSAFHRLPQGGGLSPILWSVVTDSLLRWLIRQGVFAQGYADDGVILVCGKFLDIICDVMQRMLYGVEVLL